MKPRSRSSKSKETLSNDESKAREESRGTRGAYQRACFDGIFFCKFFQVRNLESALDKYA